MQLLPRHYKSQHLKRLSFIGTFLKIAASGIPLEHLDGLCLHWRYYYFYDNALFQNLSHTQRHALSAIWLMAIRDFIGKNFMFFLTNWTFFKLAIGFTNMCMGVGMKMHHNMFQVELMYFLSNILKFEIHYVYAESNQCYINGFII